MLSNVLRIVAGGRNNVDSATEATENLNSTPDATVQHNQQNMQPPPRVGMVMDASEISWGILPSKDSMKKICINFYLSFSFN